MTQPAPLDVLFWPKGVAVVGASREPGAIGHKIVRALLDSGYRGKLHLVNPRAERILELPVFPSVSAIPTAEPVEMAVVAVPAALVSPVVDECRARGVKSLVVISAGFAEVGPEGKKLQDELLAKVRAAGMRMVGPNCFGVLNACETGPMNASFSPVFPLSGNVAMASQSGALGLAVLSLSRSYQLGLSYFVSMGNKADLSSNDLIEYWDGDPHTQVMLLYLESFGNPRRFARIARHVSRRKPIIAVKSGRSSAGIRAAGSHTAALAAADTAVDALFRQNGVIRAETLEEMFDVASAASHQPLPRGPRVGIVTNAGGPGILCTDACEAQGLVVNELSASTQAALRSILPAAAAVKNPVDMIASATPAHYASTIETVLASAEIDSLVVLYTVLEKGIPPELPRAVARAVESARKAGAREIPVLICLMSDSREVPPVRAGSEWLPAYDFPEKPARVLGRLVAYAGWRALPEGRTPSFSDQDLPSAAKICREAVERGGSWLGGEETRRICLAAGIRLPEGGIARTPDEAVAVADRIGYPVAVKLLSTTLVHKTEVGGVQLHLRNAAEVREAFDRIRSRLVSMGRESEMQGALVQRMVPPGVETLIGMTEDPVFGPLLAFGLGGIHVEILADLQFRVGPLTDRDAKSMVSGIRGARLLKGYRGHPPADEAALEEALLRVSALCEAVPEILEIDLNPVIAGPPGEGYHAADARIRVGKATSRR